MITDYDDFILEKLLQESIVYFSPEMRKKLKKMKTELSKDLLDIETQDIKDDVTFIDIDKDGYLSYNTMKNAAKFMQDAYPILVDTIQNTVNVQLSDEIYQRDMDDRGAVGIWKKSRSKIKFGRLINKLLPNKYSAKEIEEFTNRWKSILENTSEEIKVVEGDEIAFWYKSENYKEEKHTLGSSCMRGNSEDTFRIYTLNPEVCKMLIITEGDELVARAILWKPSYKSDGSFEWFMDRQYTIADSYVNKMQDYAVQQGWAYKTYNNHHSYNKVSYADGENILSKTVVMEVQLKPYSGNNFDYRYYPYVDTFRRYDPNKGTLYNDSEQVDGCYLLEDTGGGYVECETGVYSEWHDEVIPEDEAVYSDAVDSYIWLDRAVEVTDGSRRYRGWYPEGYDYITYDGYHDRYLHSNDVIYSEHYNHDILLGDSYSAIYDIDTDGEPNKDEYYVYSDDRDFIELSDLTDQIWYQKLSEEWSNWEDGRTHHLVAKDLMIKDSEDNWIPKLYSLKVYPVLDSPYDEITALSKRDADILGVELNTEKEIWIDKFRYNSEIESIYSELYTKAKELLPKLEADKESEVLAQLTKERIDEIEDKKWIDWEPQETETED